MLSHNIVCHISVCISELEKGIFAAVGFYEPPKNYVHFQTFKGTEEAVQRNIEACVELASQIRSAYGPSGKISRNHALTFTYRCPRKMKDLF